MTEGGRRGGDVDAGAALPGPLTLLSRASADRREAGPECAGDLATELVEVDGVTPSITEWLESCRGPDLGRRP